MPTEGLADDRDGTDVIIVRRLTDQPFAVNPDLIERVETTPDTILVLVDGTRYIVRESLAEIVELVREFRASVVTGALNPPAYSHDNASSQRAQRRSGENSRKRGDEDSIVVPLPTSAKGV